MLGVTIRFWRRTHFRLYVSSAAALNYLILPHAFVVRHRGTLPSQTLERVTDLASQNTLRFQEQPRHANALKSFDRCRGFPFELHAFDRSKDSCVIATHPLFQ